MGKGSDLVWYGFDRLYHAIATWVVKLSLMWTGVPLIGRFLYGLTILTAAEDTNAGFCMFLRFLFTDAPSPFAFDEEERIFASLFLPLRFKIWRFIIKFGGFRLMPPLLRPIYMSYYGRTKSVGKFISNAIEADGCKQILLLGAGYDTTAYRMKSSRITPSRSVRVYEIDRPEVQNRKIRKLQHCLAKKAYDYYTEEVYYVACDFERENFVDKLKLTNFNSSLKTAVVWEGVTYYLQPETVKQTITNLHKLFHGSTPSGCPLLTPAQSPPITERKPSKEPFTLETTTTNASDSPDYRCSAGERSNVSQENLLFFDYFDRDQISLNREKGTLGLSMSHTSNQGGAFLSGFNANKLREELEELGLKIRTRKNGSELVEEFINNCYPEKRMRVFLNNDPHKAEENFHLNVAECYIL